MRLSGRLLAFADDPGPDPPFEALKSKVQEAMLAFQNWADEILGLFGLYRKMSPVQI